MKIKGLKYACVENLTSNFCIAKCLAFPVELKKKSKFKEKLNFEEEKNFELFHPLGFRFTQNISANLVQQFGQLLLKYINIFIHI